jgi:hypothetical protein
VRPVDDGAAATRSRRVRGGGTALWRGHGSGRRERAPVELWRLWSHSGATGGVTAALARQGGAGWRPDPDGPDLGPAGPSGPGRVYVISVDDKLCELVVVVRRDAGG